MGDVLHINGQPIADIKKGFGAACKRASLEDVTPHTLRHTAATWLMQAGAPLWQASGFLAMSEKMLVEVYGHHHPDHMREAATAIGRKPFRRISA
jgi:integrase